MSVDLSKCKVGDKVLLANGETANVVGVDTSVVVHDNVPIGWRTATRWYCDDSTGKSCGGPESHSIVKLLPRRAERRKVAKCEVLKCSLFPYVSTVVFAGFKWSCAYTSAKDARRGAKRFCKAIGYECVFVDDGKKGVK